MAATGLGRQETYPTTTPTPPPNPTQRKAIPTEDEHVDGGDIEQRSERHDRVRARCAYPRRRRLYVLFLFFIFYYCTYPRRRGLNVVRDRQRQTETDRDRQRQTETDRDRQRQTETDRDRQNTNTSRDLDFVHGVL